MLTQSLTTCAGSYRLVQVWNALPIWGVSARVQVALFPLQLLAPVTGELIRLDRTRQSAHGNLTLSWFANNQGECFSSKLC